MSYRWLLPILCLLLGACGHAPPRQTNPLAQWEPSPNFDERALPVSMIVLHYTGMPDAQGALDRLTSPEARVSAHYLVDEDGTIYRLVDESKRAWHAGKSRWRGITDVNSASVGIEIVNPGHEFGYRPFPDEQVASLIPLVADIKDRHGIGRGNVVGHSDIAPSRKEDPGELFPWDALAKRRLALPVRDRSGAVFGVAQLLNRRDGQPFEASDEERFTRFSTHLGVILESWQRLDRARRQRDHP